MLLRAFTALIMAMLCAALAASAQSAASTLASAPAILSGYESADSVEHRIAAGTPAPVEGLWRLTESGALIAVERCPANLLPASAPDAWLMVVVRAPDRSVRPGTVMGALTKAALPGTYDAELLTKTTPSGTLASPRSVYLTVDSSGENVRFSRDTSGSSVNLWSLLPYMFRRLVRHKPDTRPQIHGLVRAYAATLPRYF